MSYADPEIDTEVKDQISYILRSITTGDEQEDLSTMKTLAKTMAAQRNISVEEALEVLQDARLEYFRETEEEG